MSSSSGLSALPPDSRAATLQRLRRLSRLLDNAVGIRGTPIAIGLDSILGLIPGIGDFLGAAFSAYIVFEAARLGVSKIGLIRMVINILFDSLVGIIPVIGDLFDVAWKANTKNIVLLEQHLKSPEQVHKNNTTFVLLLLGGLLVFGIGLVALGIVLIRLLFLGASR